MGGLLDNEKLWRVLSNTWGLIAVVVSIGDFFMPEKFNFLMSPVCIAYIGVLGIYAGTKEFCRWYELYDGRHPGEVFVYLWSAVMLVLVGFSVVNGHRIAPETVAAYIGVLSIYAITQKSKRVHNKHKHN